MNKLPSEVAAVVGVVDPDAYSANTYYTAYIPLKNFKRFMAVVMAGDLGTNATLDAKLIAYTDGAGTGTTDITGAAITQLTEAGTDSNKQAVINLNADCDQLAAGAFTHIRLAVTVATATSDVGAVVLGFGPRSSPASDSDASTVDEIKSV